MILKWLDQLLETQHNLTHGHWVLRKPGVGEMFMCYWRWPFNDHGKLWFHPDLADAGWHLMPCRASFIRELGGASSAVEAMTILRREVGI